ncbi:MAG TPA: aldo/keto reductase [Solirubrobacteraceae bacterium]|nr:aldo/keto reductase [Solirubrobacteraceae bacterium]
MGGARNLPLRPLGSSSLQVSPVALGSWRTYERLPRERSIEILRHALQCGVNFLDDARYDDETGSAPIPSGYSEVIFGEIFRACDVPREEVVVSEKLWWEFWPQQSAAQELAASLERLRFDYVDLIYCVALPPALSVEQAVAEVAPLLADGKARAWGVAMWSAPDIEAATRAAAAAGIAPPCAAQMAYSIASRETAGSDEMLRALGGAGASLVASAPLEGGLLSGKYARGGAGRMSGALDDGVSARALAAAAELAELAREWDTTPAALAIAFVLDHPRVASALVGATAPAQLDETLEGVALRARLSDEQRARLRAVAAARG